MTVERQKCNDDNKPTNGCMDLNYIYSNKLVICRPKTTTMVCLNMVLAKEW